MVTSGLVFDVDVANTKSYPGTGTTLFDISGNGINGTFTGSPTYSSNGYLVFSGTGQYITCPSSSVLASGTGDFAIDLWFNAANNSQNSGLFQLSTTSTYFTPTAASQLSIQLWLGYIQLGYNATFNVGNGVAANAYVANRWYYLTITRTSGVLRFYINGIQVGSNLTDTTNYTGTYLVLAGFYGAAYVLNGYLSNMRIYNGSTFSGDDVTRNFNALRGRFGA